MTSIVRAGSIAILLATTTVIGCARQPRVSSITAPAPVPTAPAPAAAPSTDEQSAVPVEIIAVEERREIVVVARPEPATFAENVNVQPIYFDFDQSDIRPEDAQRLERDAAWLKTNNMLVLIEGQCDERGTVEYNLALGDRRARATMNYLVSLGVAADRITTVSYGKERPVCDEHAESCWSLNRRAHIVVKPRG